jgi:hypothetical protein
VSVDKLEESLERLRRVIERRLLRAVGVAAVGQMPISVHKSALDGGVEGPPVGTFLPPVSAETPSLPNLIEPKMPKAHTSPFHSPSTAQETPEQPPKVRPLRWLAVLVGLLSPRHQS